MAVLPPSVPPAPAESPPSAAKCNGSPGQASQGTTSVSQVSWTANAAARVTRRFRSTALGEVLKELSQTPSAPDTPEAVYAQERLASARRFALLADRPAARWRKTDSCGSLQPFSVAFSGGGIRAAAFDAGVLWRLAERGQLRNVEHLSIVSGSAYVGTALMTYLQDAEPPPPAQLNKRYLEAVYEMIDRMQHNSGFYTRFSRRLFFHKGSWPPVLGIVALLSVTLFAVCLAPLTHIMYVAYPIALLIDAEAGDILRYSFCSDSTGYLVTWSRLELRQVAVILVVAAAAQAAARVTAACSASRMGSEAKGPGGLKRIFLLEVRNVLLVLSAFIALVAVLAWVVLLIQWADRGQHQHSCRGITVSASEATIAAVVKSVATNPTWHCSGRVDTAWHLGAVTTVDAHIDEHSMVSTSPPAVAKYDLGPFSMWRIWLMLNVAMVVAGFLGSQLRWHFLFLRLHHVLALLSPLWALYILALVARRRVFTPLDQVDFDSIWLNELAVVLGLAVILLPWYGPIRRIVHIYYRFSLRQAFYRDGKDLPLRTARGFPLCPNLIISATLVDYCRLCDLDSDSVHFSEFFFTPQHMGSERTGYIRTGQGLSAAKVMAISGAASDAFLMTKMNRVWVRVTFLALFNLFMGDYVTFSSLHRRGRLITMVQATAVHLLFVLFYAAMYVSQSLLVLNEGEHACHNFDLVFWSAWAALGLLIAASFFAFHRSCRWLLSSPLIRHIHTAFMHYHIAPEPPLNLFLNDGGLIECLGLISLLRRRCQWMLVTDATADFTMQLVCLRDSMQMAQSERLCSFFDPEDPCRGIDPLLDDFKHSERTYLRIGVLYDCWGPADAGESDAEGHAVSRPPFKGEIFFIRMRLLDKTSCVGHQRITKAEVMDGVSPSPRCSHGEEAKETSVPGMLRSDLGGCCCECCHASCNCGLLGRFPDISTGNQFLTPTQFALLCRLGYELSADAVDGIVRSQAKPEARPSEADYDGIPHAPHQPESHLTQLEPEASTASSRL